MRTADVLPHPEKLSGEASAVCFFLRFFYRAGQGGVSLSSGKRGTIGAKMPRGAAVGGVENSVHNLCRLHKKR